MDRSGDPSFVDSTSPHRPAPPLALSEFLARSAPFANYTYGYDGPGESTSTPELATFRTEEDPTLTPANRVVSGPPAQAYYGRVAMAETQSAPAQGAAAEPQIRPTLPLSSSDWLATRQQLLPSRNQGKKADWIRGWSESVDAHGMDTYCACSEPVDGPRRGKGRKIELTEGVRSILQSAASSSKTAVSSDEAIDVCRNCSRHPDVPADSDAGRPAADNKSKSPLSQSFGKKVYELLKRVKPNRMSSAHKRDAEIRQMTRPNSQPRWLSAQRLAASTPTTPRPVEKSRSMDIFPGRRPAQAVITPSSDSFSDSDAPRGGVAVSKSMSRLQRAAALLQRTPRPSE
ncbi:hypothetical protein QBC35DRAFT_68927 [Podospora australis]|uniref:Uncharacterized protein n=1 Tax=Podospora australis TaxID=1536484 RepID=A0AAN6WMG7_9PEZI|nr:hypothetical protein QBC35DRAFT_68927 [Podospora australis]